MLSDLADRIYWYGCIVAGGILAIGVGKGHADHEGRWRRWRAQRQRIPLGILEPDPDTSRIAIGRVVGKRTAAAASQNQFGGRRLAGPRP